MQPPVQPPASPASPRPVLPRPVRVAGVVFAWVLAAVVVLAVAAAVWLGIRALGAYGHLGDARAAISPPAGDIADPKAAAADILSARADARAAESLTSDPVWRAAARLPWIGPQLDAVGTVSAATADLSDAVLAPLTRVASGFSVDSLRVEDGAIDLSTFGALEAPAAQVADGLRLATTRLRAVERAPLLGPVRDGIDDATAQLSDAADAAAALHRTAALLPTMLGGSGPRTWLVLFQNPAELRSLGGMPGATAIITADGGRVRLAGQGTAVMPRFAEPVLPLEPDVQALFGIRPAVWFSGTTIVPDFAVAAPLAREMWQRRHGVDADGVVSIDPIALSYLLKATGPITLPDGTTLTAANAVSFLLNRVYLDVPDPVQQNRVFAEAAAAVFAAIAEGRADPADFVAALVRAGDEHRLLLWSTQTSEQQLLAETTLSGHLPITDADAARFGVYLNDGTGSKLGYYLKVEPTIECGPDGRSATLTVTLRSDAPADAATSLPPAIAGGNYGVPAGVLRVVGYLYLPVGSTVRDASITHAPGFGGGDDGDHRVMSFATDLAPGESSTATVTVDLADPLPSHVSADLTPAFGATSASAPCAVR